MQTSDAVMNRSFELAEQMREDEEAVAELVAAAEGKRVSLVMAKQQIANDLPAGEPASAMTQRAVSLIDRAVESVSD